MSFNPISICRGGATQRSIGTLWGWIPSWSNFDPTLPPQTGRFLEFESFWYRGDGAEIWTRSFARRNLPVPVKVGTLRRPWSAARYGTDYPHCGFCVWSDRSGGRGCVFRDRHVSQSRLLQDQSPVVGENSRETECSWRLATSCDLSVGR